VSDAQGRPVSDVELRRVDRFHVQGKAFRMGTTDATGHLVEPDCYMGALEFQFWHPEEEPVQLDLMLLREGFGLKRMRLAPPTQEVLSAGNVLGVRPGQTFEWSQAKRSAERRAYRVVTSATLQATAPQWRHERPNRELDLTVARMVRLGRAPVSQFGRWADNGVEGGAMRGLACCCVFALVAGAALGTAAQVSPAKEAPDERAQVAGVVRDYFESWYAADPDRMGRSLHPDMVKRRVAALPAGRQVVHGLTRDFMVEMTRAGGGSKVPAESRNIAVEVLDVSGDIAVARASSSEYLEYVSLAKCNGQWMIVNVLWRVQASPVQPR
jgi:hypothetical protein